MISNYAALNDYLNPLKSEYVKNKNSFEEIE